MRKILGVILVLLLAISFLAACGTGIKLAEFTLSSVIVSPSTVTVNDTVTISATVTNVGEVSGGCDVSLTVDGYSDSKWIDLASGGNTTVSFTYAAASEGSYTVTVSTPNATVTKSLTVKIRDGYEAVPVWYVGDNWVYTCSYENPDGRTKQDTNELDVTVVAEVTVGGEASYQLSSFFVPPAARDAADMPLTLHIEAADIWNSKEYMEYLKQSSAIDELPSLPTTITWNYTGDYGWPYDTGKTWSFTKHTIAGPLDIVVEREAKVLGVENVTVPAGTFKCHHIVAYDPTSPDIYTYEHWFNAAVVKSDVKMIDRDTWAGEETRVLVSYSVS